MWALLKCEKCLTLKLGMFNIFIILVNRLILKKKKKICSFHVDGNYWQKGWESRIIELKQSLLFLNQLQSLATCKLLVSLGSSREQFYIPVKLFVLNLCTDRSKHMYSTYPLYNFILLIRSISFLLLKDAYLSLCYSHIKY